MKGKPFIFLLTISLLIPLTVNLSGCGKSTTLNYLVGRWNKINLENIDDPNYVEQWEFVGDGTLYIHHKPPGAGDVNALQGKYRVVSYRKFRIMADDNPRFPPQYCGTWQIVQRKKGTLRIVKKDGGLLFCEFTKM